MVQAGEDLVHTDHAQPAPVHLDGIVAEAEKAEDKDAGNDTEPAVEKDLAAGWYDLNHVPVGTMGQVPAVEGDAEFDVTQEDVDL